MLTIEEVRWHLGDANLKKIAERSGVSYSAIYRIMADKDHVPSYNTVKLLSDYIKSRNEF